MKIALVNDMIYGYACGDTSAAGGAERYMWLQTRALVATGWSATIGVQTGLKPGERVCIDGVVFVGLNQTHLLRALYDFLSLEKPDWCHWFGASHLLGPAVAVGKLTGTRTVFSAQFDLDVQPLKALSGRRWLWPLYALGLAGSTKIFLQHGRQYTELPAVWRSKSCIVPGVVTLPSSYTPHAGRRPYVAWVGVLRQPKRPDLLVEIARNAPSVEFVVCGGASDHRSPRGYSEDMIRRFKQVPNIRYLGHVPPTQAIQIIANASLLVSTSEGEGFPSVFVEAWANGTPVVSLKIDPDQTIAGKGLGVMSAGVDGAARDIVRLVESPEAREQIASRSRAYVAQFHSAAAAVTVVQRALNGDARPSLRASQDLRPL
jgi:glycosyltransferase involved in cell wall biosynthesis